MNRFATTVVAGLLWATTVAQAAAQPADLSGRVTFNGVGVPGATITVSRGDRALATLTTDDGSFRIANLDPGAWTLRVEMRGFVPVSREITIPSDGPPPIVALTMRSFDEIVRAASTTAASPVTAQPTQVVEDQ